MKNPIVVPLDVDSLEHAQRLVKMLKGHVGGFKVGPRLLYQSPKSFLSELSSQGILFVDCKFFDIPSTTLASVKAAFDMGAHWVTVHALNGHRCLAELASLEDELRKTRPEFRVVAVTVLTSFSEKDIKDLWPNDSLQMVSVRLAEQVVKSGLTTLVASPQDLVFLRERFPGNFWIVPGVRPQGSDVGDQTRVMTPHLAMKSGANALVIGRPIIESSDPLKMVQSILGEMN